MTLHWASCDCSNFHCRSLIASGNASIMEEAATGIFPLIASFACLDRASAGMDGPTMCTNSKSMIDNLCNNASAVAFSLDAALTRGMWSVNAVTVELLM